MTDQQRPEHSETAEADETVVDAAAINTKNARILIVDDSPAVRAALEHVLSHAPLEAEVVAANDGAAALQRALAEPFDCVICDIAMPVMDGITFLRSIRQQRTRLETPVILLTVLEGLSEKVTGFRAGASDFVVKPFEHEELIARVETHVQLKRAGEQNSALNRRLRLLVDTDPLTSLANRRAFMRALRGEHARNKRTGRPFSLALIDIDHFKAVNDTHGHQAGDRVLLNIAAHLKGGARPYDVVARVGGEEFAVLLPDADCSVGEMVSERLRFAIENAGNRGEITPAITISAGVAEGPITANDGMDALYRLADERLYIAKNAGRNRVVGED